MTLALDKSSLPRVNILGVGVNASRHASGHRRGYSAVSQDKKGYVCVTGVHGIMEAQKDSAFESNYQSFYIDYSRWHAHCLGWPAERILTHAPCLRSGFHAERLLDSRFGRATRTSSTVELKAWPMNSKVN